MKHLKKFESYSSYEPINEEFVGKLLKSILSIPISALAILGVQFLSGKSIYDIAKRDMLDVYSNIDTLIDVLEGLSNRRDVTDVDIKKINNRLSQLRKIKVKYPTLDDYKKKVYRVSVLLNIKNKNYLNNQIMDYQPRVLSVNELLDKLRKIYRDVNRTDVTTSPQYQQQFGQNRQNLQDQLNNMQDREKDGGNVSL